MPHVGTDFFSHLGQHPKMSAEFNAAMSQAVAGTAAVLPHAFDFGRFSRVTDVGGGDGTLLTGVLADNYDRRKVMLVGMLLELAGGIFITTAGADEITGKDCNSATFRWSVPTFGAIEQTVRPLVEKLPKAKRWYTITPQYVFGDGLLTAAKNIFKEKGIEHVGNSYHSLTEKEFSGYLTNAMAAKPDVLLILNFGSQSSDTLRQAVSFGMKQNCTILVAWASGLEVARQRGDSQSVKEMTVFLRRLDKRRAAPGGG